MHLYYRNVNDAFTELCKGFNSGRFSGMAIYPNTYAFNKRQQLPVSYEPPISHSPSRYGEVLVINEPVTITYTNPLERCLFNYERDANPFFHLFEALWVLAGKDEISYLEHFTPKVREFSDDGITWHGAYGKRWQKVHQLESAINILRRDRSCRRVVLSMWEHTDLKRVENFPTCKDVPCNLDVMLLPRGDFLDLTVINRSNDMILGALGSNYVTFSFLLEYMSLATGFKPNVYSQITNNLHVYAGANGLWSGKWSPEKLLKSGELADPYVRQHLRPQSLFQLTEDSKDFMTELGFLFHAPDFTKEYNCYSSEFSNKFLQHTVRPMLLAWNDHKARNYTRALAHCLEIASPDWSMACGSWIERRAYAWQERNTNASLRTD